MEIINEKYLHELLEKNATPAKERVEEILERAALMKGLPVEDVALLVNVRDEGLLARIFSLAARIKHDIYGERLVLFAPLYVSDHCVNDCAYCNFHAANRTYQRHLLSMEEVAEETKCLIGMGHKRVLIEFGEDEKNNPIDYVCQTIKTIYAVKVPIGNIRRVNVNIAATTVENYRRLKAEDIGTYQLFQETYYRETYKAYHKGPKSDYDRQLTAHDRAREAGLDDLGIGVLFGLYDWRFEVLALIAHADHMNKNLGVGPHTISVPRFRSAPGIDFKPKHEVNDADFFKLIAILRIAVPYTGMILSTRESPEFRRHAFQLGVSQASAASVTVPGGYAKQKHAKELTQHLPDGTSHGDEHHHECDCSYGEVSALQAGTMASGLSSKAKGDEGQFRVQDERPVDEVIKSVIREGLIPSFCTACYRLGRTGEHFMELAKPGEIHKFCRPNALLTFEEYLLDFGDAESRELGDQLIAKYLVDIEDPQMKEETVKRLERIRSGERDLFF